jgi:uncharacterized protein YbaR (Trm112 family)
MLEQHPLPEFLLKVLRCPKTHSKLRLADDAMLARLNSAIESGKLHNQSGQLVKERLDGALLNADEALAYPIRYSIPVMLSDEALPLSQLTEGDVTLERLP